jgi:arylsulfatase
MCAESGPVFPAGKELWDAREAGTLNDDQQDVFLQPRPADELYNVQDDPHQMHNLAADPAHAETLAELKNVLARWTEETGDSVPAEPTPSVKLFGAKQHTEPKFKRGPLPGADCGAEKITADGPVRKPRS